LYALQVRQARLLTHPDRSGATMNAVVPTINVDEHDVHDSHERHTIFIFPSAATSTRGCRKDRLRAPSALYRRAMGSIETKAYRFCCTAFSRGLEAHAVSLHLRNLVATQARRFRLSIARRKKKPGRLNVAP
jgi:hypothetical protein